MISIETCGSGSIASIEWAFRPGDSGSGFPEVCPVE
jgi:hypothetical protein